MTVEDPGFFGIVDPSDVRHLHDWFGRLPEQVGTPALVIESRGDGHPASLRLRHDYKFWSPCYERPNGLIIIDKEVFGLHVRVGGEELTDAAETRLGGQAFRGLNEVT